MMKSKSTSPFSRRRFISTAAAATTAGSISLRGLIELEAAPDGTGETDHFSYRLAPKDGPYIDSHRDNKAFARSEDKILLSEDNGKTWSHRLDFPDASKVNFSCILGNGNIVFSTEAKLYLSTDNLKTYRQIVVKDRDGSDYIEHTPKDPEKPGHYYHSLDGVHTWEIEGKEILVWGNYTNVIGGVAPVNIYYSTDNGETVKIAYSFGQNPKFQEKGTDLEKDPLLGAEDNEVICRHLHSVMYNPEEDAFYACSGDIDRGFGNECHWLRGTYDQGSDSWDWKVLVSVNSNSRHKSGGIHFVDGELYWAADANGPKTIRESYDRGIFHCAPGDIADLDKHTRMHNHGYEIGVMIIEDDFILAAHCAPASPHDCGFLVSPDLGKTWAQYDLKEFGKRSGVRFHQKNSDGWFRVDLRTGWVDPSEVLFIKPKPQAS